jgi:hypothetical protein
LCKNVFKEEEEKEGGVKLEKKQEGGNLNTIVPLLAAEKCFFKASVKP